jgi:hypothetical protein
MQINISGQTTLLKIAPAKTTCSIYPKENDSQTMPNYGAQPLTKSGKEILSGKYKKLLDMSDGQLLNIMWGKGGLHQVAPYLKNIISSHFRGRTGREITVPMPDSYWNINDFNNRSKIVADITDAIRRALDEKKWDDNLNYEIDASFILDQANLSFRSDFFNPSMAIVMGGVAEARVRTAKVQQNNGVMLDIFNNKEYTITIEIILRDWFGMDENDFAENNWYNNPGKAFVTWGGREALTAFWILQHQRGYPSFIWNAVFKSEIKINNSLLF